MSKINISFNNKTFNFAESALETAKATFKTHLSSTMNGDGAAILFDGISYNIDSTKLSAAENIFAAYLDAVSDTEVEDEPKLAAGLYNDGVMTASWDELVSSGVITVENGVVVTGRVGNSDRNTSTKHLVGDLVLPDDGSITSLGDSAFYCCWNLTSITIPNTVTIIGESALGECHLTNIMIPNSVTTIGGGAFYENSFTSITIPDSVTTFGDWVFEGTYSLESIVIGRGITAIPKDMLSYNEQLTSITFNGTVEQWNALPKGEGWNDGVPATEVICTDGTVAL